MTRQLGWPNLVTLLRLGLTIPFLYLLIDYGRDAAGWKRHAALAVFGVMALTDFLDGLLARRLNQFTPLGRFLDPLADKLLIVSSLVILMFVGMGPDAGRAALRVPWWMVAAGVCKDVVVVAGFAAIYLRHRRVHIEARRLGKWCTFVQMLALLGVLAWPDMPVGWGALARALFAVAAVLAGAATLDYLRVGWGEMRDGEA